jgi:hypothetical protein
MAIWLSVADVVRDLGLQSSPDDRDAVRSEIRRAIAVIHPDHNGGTFANLDAQTQYERLVQALEFLDRPTSTALIPIQHIPALVAAIKESLTPVAKDQTAVQARAEFRDTARAELHQRLFLPRIGSGVFAAVFAFLLTIGEKFREDPLLGWWVNSGSAGC